MISEYGLYYIEASVVCIIVLLIMLHNALHNVDKQMNLRYMTSCVICESLYFAADVVWTLFENGTPSQILLTNMLLYIIMNVMGYSMFQYSLSIQERFDILSAKHQFYMTTVMFLNILMICFTGVTKLYFYTDSNGKLVLGPLYYLMLALAMLYPITACIVSFITAYKKDNNAERNLFLVRGFAYVPLLLGGVLQACFNNIPIACYGITISMIVLYLYSVTSYISLDPLTQINNRSSFTKYLAEKLRDGNEVSLIIMDLDDFKGINDTYGHVEGDTALIRVAHSLKVACSGFSPKNRCFISRFGGDEFMVVIQGDYDLAAKLCTKIQETLTDLNTKAGAEYSLLLSFGIATSGPEASTIPALTQAADKRLYKQKKAKHTVRHNL